MDDYRASSLGVEWAIDMILSVIANVACRTYCHAHRHTHCCTRNGIGCAASPSRVLNSGVFGPGIATRSAVRLSHPVLVSLLL